MTKIEIVNNKLGIVAVDACKMIFAKVEKQGDSVSVATIMACSMAQAAGYSLEQLIEGVRRTWETMERSKYAED